MVLVREFLVLELGSEEVRLVAVGFGIELETKRCSSAVK